MPDLKSIISAFGAEAKAKLANAGATGEPEDQLRAPLEKLFTDQAELCGFKREWFAAVGETSLSTLKNPSGLRHYPPVCRGGVRGSESPPQRC